MVPTRRSLAAFAATTTLAVFGAGAADAHADVTITSPADGAYVNDTTPVVTYTGATPNTSVVLTDDHGSTTYGTSTSDGNGDGTVEATRSVVVPGLLNPINGYVTVRDTAAGLDDTAAFHADVTPSLSGSTGGNGYVYPAGDVHFDVTDAIPGRPVRLYIDDATTLGHVPAATATASAVDATDEDGNVTLQAGSALGLVPAGLTPGEHTATVVSVDADGTESSVDPDSGTATFVVAPGNPTFRSLFDGASLNTTAPAIEVDGIDADATKVSLYELVDGDQVKLLDKAVSNATTTTLTPTLAAGTHQLTLTQTVNGTESRNDLPGLDVSVTVDTGVPTLDRPFAGSVVDTHDVRFSASDALEASLDPDDPAPKVRFYVDGVAKATVDSDTNGMADATVPGVADGAHTAWVTTIDALGHESAKSADVPFTVDTTVPVFEEPTGPQSGNAPTTTTTTTTTTTKPQTPAPVVTPPVTAPAVTAPKPDPTDVDGDGITTTWLVKGKAAAAPAAPKLDVKGGKVTVKVADAPKGAKTVRLYRALADGTFKLVKTVSVKAGSITDKTAKAGRTYRYKTVFVNAKGQQGKASKAVKAKLKK